MSAASFSVCVCVCGGGGGGGGGGLTVYAKHFVPTYSIDTVTNMRNAYSWNQQVIFKVTLPANLLEYFSLDTDF